MYLAHDALSLENGLVTNAVQASTYFLSDSPFYFNTMFDLFIEYGIQNKYYFVIFSLMHTRVSQQNVQAVLF